MAVNLEDQTFLDAVATADVGDTVEGLVVEYIFDHPVHTPFHQRIFEPGKILRKPNENIRVHVPASLIGMTIDEDYVGFEELQTGDPDRGIPRREVEE